MGFAYGLCWLHAERHVARMIPLDRRQQQAYDRPRDAIWHYYQELKAYRDAPTQRQREQLAWNDQLTDCEENWVDQADGSRMWELDP